MNLGAWVQSLQARELTKGEGKALRELLGLLHASSVISEHDYSEAASMILSRVRERPVDAMRRHSDLYVRVSEAGQQHPQSLEEATTKLHEAREMLSRTKGECALADEARDSAIAWVQWLQRDIQRRLGQDITDEELS